MAKMTATSIVFITTFGMRARPLALDGLRPVPVAIDEQDWHIDGPYCSRANSQLLPFRSRAMNARSCRGRFPTWSISRISAGEMLSGRATPPRKMEA